MSPIQLGLPTRPILARAVLRLGLAVLGAFAVGAAPSLAAESAPVRLFKIVTAKDEIVVGLTPDELDALGPGPDLEKLARRLAGEGQITVWRYAVRKAGDGALQQAPMQRVAVFRQDTLRIEPYAAALPVVPPAGP